MQLYRIGEIAEKSGLSIKTLRYYEEFGLIKPKKVDIFTGYRYYDEFNLEKLLEIKALKDLGFSLLEIKNFNEIALKKKTKEIKLEIKLLKKKLKMITFLEYQKGEKVMKPFINDKLTIGRWQYKCSVLSKENYFKNDTFLDNEAIRDLYFLPNGEGYWIFEGWTKGIVYHFHNIVYKYSIENDKLFLEIYDDNQNFENICVYSRVDNKEYTKTEIAHKDDTNLPFELDKEALGSWVAVDWISIKDKENYKPKTSDDLFLKSLALMENGDCYKEYESGNVYKINWTKNYILSHENSLASHFIIREIEGNKYLIMDWKSGDYVYGGEIYGCYVFKKVK